MNVLLVDIGNTRIKWARLRAGRQGPQRAAAHAGWSADRYRAALFGSARAPAGLRVMAVSVAGAAVERRFAAAVRAATGRAPQLVRSTRRAGGVVNGYADVWRLGADRWVALLGAHDGFHPARAACVIDIGTAMTIDLLDARGRHRGGAIVPGPRLMVDSLLAGTSGIGRRAGRRPAGPRTLFARATRAGLEAGAAFAVAAAVERALREARRTLGTRRVELLLTGGAAREVAARVEVPHRLVPDLVLRGLAVLCRLDART